MYNDIKLHRKCLDSRFLERKPYTYILPYSVDDVELHPHGIAPIF